jgi:hypothetical protein
VYQHTLHCAGNDANLAIRLLLAKVLADVDSTPGRTAPSSPVDRIRDTVHRELPSPPAWDRRRVGVNEDYEGYVGDASDMLLLNPIELE